MNNKLSYTAVEKYIQCPKAYYLYYIRNMREKSVGSALIFGSAIDVGVNTLLESKQAHPNQDDGLIFTTLIDAEEQFIKQITKQKLNGVETDLSKTSLLKYSNSDFDPDVLTKEQTKELQDFTKQKSLDSHHEYLVQMKRQGLLTGEAHRQFNYMSWLSLKQKGLMMIDAYQKQVIPNIEEVLDVQKFFSLKNDEGDEFLGFIDYICRWKGISGIVVKDNKTSSSAYKASQADESKQLHSYVGALNELGYTKEPISIGFDVLNKVIRKKKEPRVNIQFIPGKVNTDLIDAVFQDYDTVNEAIHDGLFESKHPECSKNNFGSPCLCQVPKDALIHVPKSEKK